MKIFLLILIIFSMGLIFVQDYSYAQNPIGLNRTSQPGGIVPQKGNSAGTLSVIVRNLITLFYSIGSLGFMIMIIWGAVDWILSGGDKEKVAGGRKKIMTAITGLVILALSFPIAGVIAQITGIDIFGNLPLKNLSTP